MNFKRELERVQTIKRTHIWNIQELAQILWSRHPEMFKNPIVSKANIHVQLSKLTTIDGREINSVEEMVSKEKFVRHSSGKVYRVDFIKKIIEKEKSNTIPDSVVSYIYAYVSDFVINSCCSYNEYQNFDIEFEKYVHQEHMEKAYSAVNLICCELIDEVSMAMLGQEWSLCRVDLSGYDILLHVAGDYRAKEWLISQSLPEEIRDKLIEYQDKLMLDHQTDLMLYPNA